MFIGSTKDDPDIFEWSLINYIKYFTITKILYFKNLQRTDIWVLNGLPDLVVLLFNLC